MLALISRALGRVEHPASGKFSISGFFRGFAPLFGRRASLGKSVEHLGTLPLTAQSSLALIRFNHETLLIGITTQNVTLLARAPESGEPEGGAAVQRSTSSVARTRFVADERFGTKENFNR
jgi:flagellar biogenesis protein FliO